MFVVRLGFGLWELAGFFLVGGEWVGGSSGAGVGGCLLTYLRGTYSGW